MDIEIRKYLKLVTRWWWLLVVSAVIPMAVSYYFTSQQLDLYQAKATVMVGTSLQNPDPDRGQMDLSNTLAAAYAELVRQGPVVEPVIERLGLDRTPEKLASQISTWLRPGAHLLEIYVTDTNPEAAAVIANALADEIIRRSPASGGSDPEQQEFIRGQLEELQAKIASTSKQIDDLTASLSELTSAAEIQDAQGRIAALEEVQSTYQATYADLLDSYSAESPNVLLLFEPAIVPPRPMPSKTKLVVAVAGVAGLGLALSAVFLIEYLDNSLRWEGNGAQSILGMPILAAVPRMPRGRGSLIASDRIGPVTEACRALQAGIFLASSRRPCRTLLFASTDASEGKSFILANLAVVMAASGKRVIVVDADMRQPSLHKHFDRPNILGLAELLSDHVVPGDERLPPIPLQETDFDNLLFLSAGRPPADAASLLTSPRLAALLDALNNEADVVLLDSPPVLGPPDAMLLATLAEGTILVVSAGATVRHLAEQARDRLLEQGKTDLLGIAFNRVKADGTYYDDAVRRKKRRLRLGRRKGDQALLTLSEMAEYLGISGDMAKRWCKTGRLPAFRSRLRWYIQREELERSVGSLMVAEEVWGQHAAASLDTEQHGPADEPARHAATEAANGNAQSAQCDCQIGG